MIDQVTSGDSVVKKKDLNESSKTEWRRLWQHTNNEFRNPEKTKMLENKSNMTKITTESLQFTTWHVLA